MEVEANQKREVEDIINLIHTTTTQSSSRHSALVQQPKLLGQTGSVSAFNNMVNAVD